MKNLVLLFPLLLSFSCVHNLYTNKSEESYFYSEKISLSKDLTYTRNKSFFKSFDATELYEQLWLAENNKASLVIVHGLNDHSERYDEVAKKFIAYGISVYSYDLRGHGKSKGDRVWINTFDEHINDLNFFYYRIMQREYNKPVFIMGHGMGGTIVLKFVLDKKPEIKSIILSAPALKPTTDTSYIKSNLVKTLGETFPYLPIFELDINKFSRDKKQIEKMITDPLIYKHNAPVKNDYELLKVMDKLNENFSLITDDILLLHGSKDMITNPEGSKDLYEKISSKNKELKIYNGLVYDLLHEPEKDQVFADILLWVKKEINNERK